MSYLATLPLTGKCWTRRKTRQRRTLRLDVGRPKGGKARMKKLLASGRDRTAHPILGPISNETQTPIGAVRSPHQVDQEADSQWPRRFRQRNAHRMTNLQFKLVFGLFSLFMLGTPLYAQIIDQSLCVQCLSTTKVELKKCLEAANAIKREVQSAIQ